MVKHKGFTLIELLIVIAIISIVASTFFGGRKSDADRHNECVYEATHLFEEERMSYCIDKIKEEDRNSAIRYSNF